MKFRMPRPGLGRPGHSYATGSMCGEKRLVLLTIPLMWKLTSESISTRIFWELAVHLEAPYDLLHKINIPLRHAIALWMISCSPFLIYPCLLAKISECLTINVGSSIRQNELGHTMSPVNPVLLKSVQ